MLSGKALLLSALSAGALAAATSTLTIKYPAAGSVFPPEFAPPTFLWVDSHPEARRWLIEIRFKGTAALRIPSAGEPPSLGEIDAQCAKAGAEPPKLPPDEAGAHAWKPDRITWETIKQRSLGRSATVTISGYSDESYRSRLSEGRIAIETSKDPVGAPIFYRDVPLISVPTGERGVIMPLPSNAVPLIAWRLKRVGDEGSKLMMSGLPTCINCHSFSRDGKTIGLDVDGPQNDKGLYGIVPVATHTSIRNDDVIRWSEFRDERANKRFGFMSQISPDGQYVVTSIEDPKMRVRGVDNRLFNGFYRDYGFGQVFYPTRGVLAWYSRAGKKLKLLPGADDPRYVQTSAFWSPDGKYLVFSRAEAKDPFREGQKQAQYANDPAETQIQYDLYRIPFNGGAGGVAEPLEGASANGFSNNFPKVSPDGRWIVYVRNKTGLLMRPDSELYIVPSTGGRARRLRANMSRMNSWHSFSPNGRWLVFSSKGRSLYTQMLLTHIDENGNDTPPILIENATAANRAVNIPEFVNSAPGTFETMDAPATEFYRLFELASNLNQKGEYAAAALEWKKAVALEPADARANNNLGVALVRQGQIDAAIPHYRKALESEPEYGFAHLNLGVALAAKGQFDEALPHLETAAKLDAGNAQAFSDLGAALVERGRLDEGISASRRALAIDPSAIAAHNNIAIALLRLGKWEEAVPHLEKALAAQPDSIPLRFTLARILIVRGRVAEAIPHLESAAASDDPAILGTLAAACAQVGRVADALRVAQRGLEVANARRDSELVRAFTESIRLYESAAR